MDKTLMDAITKHHSLMFMGCGGTDDIETGIELLDLLSSLLDEVNDLHAISPKHIVRQLNCIQMLLSTGLTQVRTTQTS